MIIRIGPGTAEERIIVTRALARKVMVVAVFHVKVGDWAAYIDAVPGENHPAEWQAVMDRGDKLPAGLSMHLFGSEREGLGTERPTKEEDPVFGGPYRWRD